MKNNAKLTAAVQEVTGSTKVQAETAIAAVLSSIKNLTTEEGRLVMIGYGTFAIKQRAEKVGRNPKSGVEITIPAREEFTFKAAK